jgi:hypothetical protein
MKSYTDEEYLKMFHNELKKIIDQEIYEFQIAYFRSLGVNIKDEL